MLSANRRQHIQSWAAVMRAPSNTQLIIAAIVLWLIGSWFSGGYVPAKHRLVGSDGVVLHSADGKVLYDMELYNQEVQLCHRKRMAFVICWACGTILFLWAVVRAVVTFLIR